MSLTRTIRESDEEPGEEWVEEIQTPPHKFRKTEMVDLVAEEQILTVSKNVLTKASPVFKAMIENEGFVEGKTQTIHFPNKKEKDVAMMLTFISPKADFERPPVIDARIMLKYADEYQINSLIRECEKVLVEEINNSSKASLEHVYIASKYNMSSLLDSAMEKCSELSPKELTEKSYQALVDGGFLTRPLPERDMFGRVIGPSVSFKDQEKAVDELVQPQDLIRILRNIANRMEREEHQVCIKTLQLQREISSKTLTKNCLSCRCQCPNGNCSKRVCVNVADMQKLLDTQKNYKHHVDYLS